MNEYEEYEEYKSDMLEAFIMYKTNDGKIFTSEKLAFDHIVDKVGEEIEEMLEVKDAVAHNARFKLILCLCGDIHKLRKLNNITNKWIK